MVDDGLSSIPSFRNNLLRSQLSSDVLASAGPLFLYFDDLQVQNHRLQQEAADLEYDVAKQALKQPAPNSHFDDSPDSSFDASGADGRVEFDQLKEELQAARAAGRKLINEKEALEAELHRLKAAATQSSQTVFEKELSGLEREAIQLRAKCRVVRTESKRLNMELLSPKAKPKRPTET